MTHLSDDDLVLLHYREADEAERMRGHLDGCASCRERLEALERELGAVSEAAVPPRGESYGREVWARIAPRLDEPERQSWWPKGLFTWPRLALVGSVAVLVVAAFIAGRVWRAPVSAPSTEPATVDAALQGQERILLLAVAHHLERSSRMLVELTNLNGGGTVNISFEQEQAADLIAANRLYRQAAARAGEKGLAGVLDDLERVMVEVTNSPSTLSAAEAQGLRQRIDDTGLLFKIRVTESQVQQRQREGAARLQQGARS